MSLVNVANVCSHLQNASKARLAITSVNATKLHARLMLALQRQGFLDSVVIGGKTPPQPYKMQTPPETHEKLKTIDAIQKEPWRAFPKPDEPKKGPSSTEAISSSSNPKEAVDSQSNLEQKTIISHSQQGQASSDLEPTPELSSPLAALRDSLSQNKLGSTTLNEPLLQQLRALAKKKHKVRDVNLDVPASEAIPSNPANRRLWLGMKYWDSVPVLSRMSMISKPKKRITLDYQELLAINRGQTIKEVKGLTSPGECIFLATDRGVLEAREAIERRVGGLVLCRAS